MTEPRVITNDEQQLDKEFEKIKKLWVWEGMAHVDNGNILKELKEETVEHTVG